MKANQAKEKSEMISRRQMLTASAAGATALVYPFSMARAQGSPTPDQVFFDPEIPALGNPKGDVTIVEYFDYQCPYCKVGHPELMKVVEQDGKVRLVMKDFPIFGSVSIYASTLVLAAHSEKAYEQALNALMATEGRLRKEQVDAALLRAGLDPTGLHLAFKRDAKRIDAIIARNMAQASAFNLGGTPAFVIGRKIYPGLMNEKALKEAIAEARKA